MKFKIIPLYSGKRAKTYTIHIAGDELNSYYKFVFALQNNYSLEILSLDEKIRNMCQHHGLDDNFFKRESPLSHNVFRVTGTGNVRLYCIKFSKVAIIVSGGGIKKAGTIKLAENPNLLSEVKFLQQIEDQINSRIDSGEIQITNDEITGNLEF